MGRMIFELRFEEEDYAEDLAMGRGKALKIAAEVERHGWREFSRLESSAVKETRELLSSPDFTITRIDRLGYEGGGAFCGFDVPDLDALEQIVNRVEDLIGAWRSDDDIVINLDTFYMQASNFIYYPRRGSRGIDFVDIDTYILRSGSEYIEPRFRG